MISENTQFEC